MEFGGSYPQNSGPAYTENFRDTYRRCVYIFFASAAESNPESRLVLFLNRAWKTESSKVSKEVSEGLDRLGVEVIIIPFTFNVSSSVGLWKNQFFVLDVIRFAYLNWSTENLLVILDSDIIWNPRVNSDGFWDELLKFGLLTYEIKYGPFEVVNGLSRQDLTIISEAIEPRNAAILPYLGGEFIALDLVHIEKIFLRIEKDYALHLSRISANLPSFTEEAHFLSHIYSVLDHPHHDASRFVKRIWTMFLRFQNSNQSDKSLLLLHVPAEKNYGIRRLYKMCKGDKKFSDIFEFSTVGIPSNPIKKIIRDSSWAVLRRFWRKVRFLR